MSISEKLLRWRDDNTPESRIYDDIYFSTDNGLEESRAVFLDGINAPKIWENRSVFKIGELGFGTGLNFFNTLKLWLETTKVDQKLHYVATEKYPLSNAEIERAIVWSELKPFVSNFLNKYSQKKINLLGGRVTIELLIGDSHDRLSEYNTVMDAWYLDGFAPSKNPDMWSDVLFDEITRLSKPGTRLATFTAAGFVRRSLSKKGFQMSKRPGFGRKREMLNGVYGNTDD